VTTTDDALSTSAGLRAEVERADAAGVQLVAELREANARVAELEQLLADTALRLVEHRDIAAAALAALADITQRTEGPTP
jgi:hypothetical protein